MSRIQRFISSVALVAAIAAAAGLGLTALTPSRPVGAAPAAAPMLQAVTASGIVTTGSGVCFPDAVLLDCTGAVIEQIKGPGGAGSFASFYNQWVEVSGTRVACTGGTYLNVVSIQNQTNPCPNGTSVPGQATATAAPPPTPTPVPAVPTATPSGGASGSDNLAFGRPIVASTSQTGFPPENAIDADPNSAWASLPGGDPFNRAQNQQWIYVDLGGDVDVSSIQTLWGPQRHARGYALYLWVDSARAWRQLGSTNYGTGDDTWTIRGGGSVKGRYFMLWLVNPYIMGSHYELRDWIIKGPGSSTSGGPGWENVARGKAVVAEHETPGFPAANVVDGDLATLWESARVPAWIYVDLGAATTVSRVTLHWAPGKHATDYVLYAWNGANWAGLYQRRNGPGGDETIDLRSFNTRYVLLAAAAGPSQTVSLREFEVLRYTSTGGGSINPPTPTPTPPAPPPPPIPLGRFELSHDAGASDHLLRGIGVGPAQITSRTVPAPATE